MIDIRLLRDNPQAVKENIKKRFQNDKVKLVDEILKLDEEWRSIKFKEDSLRSNRNKISKEVSELKKAGKDAKKKIKEAGEIPGKIEKIEEKRKILEEKIDVILRKIPNFVFDEVPIGKDESQNKEIKKIGKPETYNYEIYNHAELAEKIGGADFDSSSEISGNGFYFLKGDLALLSAALINYARDCMVKHGFEYVEPPLMVRKKIIDGVMSFEDFEGMIYKIEGEDLYLIATSEHPLIGMFVDKKLRGKDLPIKITGFSPCFRKEIGAHGIEEKGFYRRHQFNKQEMVVLCNPEDSKLWYDKMIQFTIDVFTELNIPVRILESCSGDLADLKARGCDIEAWSPRQKKYFEVGSCSNLTDAQARRLNIRAEAEGKIYSVHTLNNTVLATPRALIAIMENNQQKDGSIKVPKVLQPYMLGKKVIGKK